jgi:protein-disulfide isomerase
VLRARASIFVLLAFVVVVVAACASGPAPAPETRHGQTPASGDASSSLEAARAADGAAMDPGTAVPVSAADPSWGNADAPVTLVVWGDYQCRFTAKLMGTLVELKLRYGPARLRIVYKHNPLPFHEEAYPTAIAAETVLRLAGNAAFWRFHEVAFANQDRLTPENVIAWAVAAGVSARELDAALASRRFAAKVDEDMEVGKRAGVRGTPASFINGVFLNGALPLERFAAAIDEQSAEAAALLRAGVPEHRLYAEASQRNRAREPVSPSKQAPEDTTTVWKVPVAGAAARGAPAPLVTLVMFGEFACPFCAKSIATVTQLERKYAGKLRLVFRHNPLPFHPRAEPAAQLAIEARAQKGDRGFWEAFELLFAHGTELEDAHLLGYAATLGLDPARTRRAIESKKHADAIARDQELADDLEAKGTPHFFINGRRLGGAQSAERFEAIIDDEIRKAEQLVAAGTPAAGIYDKLQKDARVKVPQRVVVPAATAAQPGKGAARGAKVTIQMFADFQCPFCKRAQPTLDEVIAAFPGKVRVVWRHLPLPMHRQAAIAAEAAEEAFRQKGDAGFWAMAKLLFEDQTAASLDRPALAEKAAKVGLDVRAFDAALDSGRHRAKIEADSKAAADAGIKGTPGFAINDYFLSGAHPLRGFERLVRRALGPREPPSPGSLLTSTPAPSAALPSTVPPDHFGAKHLLVMYQGSRRASPGITRTKIEARARAQEALAKVKRGVSFTDVVREYSDEPGAATRGGDLGTFPKGAMVPEFQAPLEKLAVGSTSGIVETPFGFHVILRTR